MSNNKNYSYIEIYENNAQYIKREPINEVKTTTEQAAARLFWYLYNNNAKIHEMNGSDEGRRVFVVEFFNNSYIYVYHNINI